MKLFILTLCLVPFLNCHAANTMLSMETSKGTLKIELFDSKTPITVKNFLRYVKNKKYNNTIFHRVIDNFMIQGGGFTKSMTKVETYPPIKNEATKGPENESYTLAMARTNNPHSATNQFFINVNNNSFLNAGARGGAGYAVFGKVVEGTSIVNAIKKVQTTSKGGRKDVPVEPVLIKSVKILKAKTSEKKKAKTPKA